MMCNSEKVIEFKAGARGFHFFRGTWIPREEEKLETCHHQKNNACDIYAIKIVTESNQIVSHLSRKSLGQEKFCLIVQQRLA